MDDARTAQRLAVAAEVRALMGRYQVSQERLGQAINLGQTGLSRRLRGKVPFDIDDLLAIAEHFGVPVTDLVAPASLPTDTRSGSSVPGLRVLAGAGV
jgi:transcriptional regulator with XRE-family HTH domain